MTPARWQHIQALFDEALQQPPAERAAFLARACGGDADLQAEVASLLEADAGAHTLLEGHALDALDALAAPDFAGMLSREGQQVGPYRLERLIGEGGMGAVYLARRADGLFQQQVALKLIKRGMDTARIVRRFEAERQILARLQHDNIARLLDGGMTDDGLPYFAMEYVDGLPIDRYCDEHRLSVDARLDLFVTVCKAVLYAHAQLVVHRDLKPENILVIPGDPATGAAPQVKLLDFGIAKMLADDGTQTQLTQAGGRVLTPGYASPEQVRGEAIGTSSDIYSLGVVLYELLVGQRPFAAGPHGTASAGATEPERPSTVLSRVTDGMGTAAAAAISQARSTQPDKLRRRLAGDLDVICLKALRPEPARRYGSVDAFSEDIRRHRTGLPVQARLDTLGYRVRKFTGRHRAAVGATVAVVALVAVLVGFYTARLSQERDRAQVEAEKARQVAAFLQSVFEVTDPSEARGTTVTARELLDQGARRVATELDAQPEVQAQMMHVIGNVYHSLGLYDAAAPLQRQALQIRRSRYGPAHPEVVATMSGLAEALEAQGDYDGAERLLRDALHLQQQRHGPDHPAAADVLDDLGWIHYRKGDYAAAEDRYREALALRRRHLAAADPALAESLDNVAKALHAQGDYAPAETLYREALARNRAAYGEAHRAVATTMSNLANLLREVGQTDEALDLHRSALAVRRTLLGDDHPHVTSSLNSLAVLLFGEGRYDEAEPLYREALALRRQRLGEDHPQVAVPLTGLATLLYRKGELAEAERLFRASLALHRKTLPAGHANIAHPLVGLGVLLADQGGHDDALPYLQEAYTLRQQGLPEGHWRTAQAAGALGHSLSGLGRFHDAEPLLVESYRTLKAVRGGDDRLTQRALARLVDCYAAWGRAEEAAAYRAQIAQRAP